MAASIYTVGQINHYIKNMFTQDFLLSNVQIQGEVSNCKYHTSGHIYFSIKDETGTLACIMFAGQRKGLAFSMKNGDQVVVRGNVSIYERDGRYQLYAREIIQAGAGLLYEKFQALKKELEEMGMFDESYKQPIPKHIQTLGVVTAPTGAAIRDICSVAKRRCPGIQIILYPALVQGEGAKDSIVKGIRELERLKVDVMIVGRGGGSMEDLWAFNEEIVARAIFDCSIPVISAVGHETDVTIADYVADLRAATPSAAAELAVDDVKEQLVRLAGYRQYISGQMRSCLEANRQSLGNIRTRLGYLSPKHQIQENRQYLADLEEKLRQGMGRRVERDRNQVLLYVERLKGLSPLDKLTQGYSYTEKENRAVTSITQVAPEDRIKIYVRDGLIEAAVEETKNKDE